MNIAFGLCWVVALCVGCASYQGSAREVSAQQIAADPGWVRVSAVPLVRQRATKDCGAAALSSVLRYWRSESDAALSRESIDAALKSQAGAGITARDLRDYARKAGFAAFVFKGSVTDLEHELALHRPVLVGMHKPISSGEALAHYQVVLGYHPKRQMLLLFDPANGLQQDSVEGFMREWAPAGQVTLVVIPEPGADSKEPASAEQVAAAPRTSGREF